MNISAQVCQWGSLAFESGQVSPKVRACPVSLRASRSLHKTTGPTITIVLVPCGLPDIGHSLVFQFLSPDVCYVYLTSALVFPLCGDGWRSAFLRVLITLRFPFLWAAGPCLLPILLNCSWFLYCWFSSAPCIFWMLRYCYFLQRFILKNLKLTKKWHDYHNRFTHCSWCSRSAFFFSLVQV